MVGRLWRAGTAVDSTAVLSRMHMIDLQEFYEQYFDDQFIGRQKHNNYIRTYVPGVYELTAGYSLYFCPPRTKKCGTATKLILLPSTASSGDCDVSAVQMM